MIRENCAMLLSRLEIKIKTKRIKTIKKQSCSSWDNDCRIVESVTTEAEDAHGQRFLSTSTLVVPPTPSCAFQVLPSLQGRSLPRYKVAHLSLQSLRVNVKTRLRRANEKKKFNRERCGKRERRGLSFICLQEQNNKNTYNNGIPQWPWIPWPRCLTKLNELDEYLRNGRQTKHTSYILE